MMQATDFEPRLFVKKLLNVFVDICLLRAAPQDLPASTFLLFVTIVLGVITGTITLVETLGGVGNAFMAQLADLGLLVLFLKLGLTYRNLSSRFLQSATALFGCGFLVNLVAMPLQLLIGEDPSASVLAELGVLLYVFLMVWAIVIVAHVFRHTFELRFLGGTILAIGYFLFLNLVVQVLFPVG
jgi:hypothetical protein